MKVDLARSKGATPQRSDLEALYLLEYEALVRLAYTLVDNRAEAEEVVQDAFVDLNRRWNQLLNPGAYLRTAVVNGARRRLRRRIQGEAIHRRLKPTMQAQTDDLDYVLDMVDALPERQRAAVVLAYYADMTSAEIGDVLGCRPATARSLVHRGLRRIRAELAE